MTGNGTRAGPLLSNSVAGTLNSSLRGKSRDCRPGFSGVSFLVREVSGAPRSSELLGAGCRQRVLAAMSSEQVRGRPAPRLTLPGRFLAVQTLTPGSFRLPEELSFTPVMIEGT